MRSTRAFGRRLVRSLVAAAAIGGAIGAVCAAPINPLPFPSSLGATSLVATTYTINTSTTPPTLAGTSFTLNGILLTGLNGPDVAAFRFDSLTIPTGAVVNVTGTRPVALLATGNITIAGTINAAGGNGGDPTGSFGLSGGLGGAAGGGGGGAGGAGGNGGSGGGVVFAGESGQGNGAGVGGGTPNVAVRRIAGTFGGGPGVAVFPHLALIGGAGGGGAGDAGTGGGKSGGGGGGGAIEIGTLGTLTVSGTINASGGASGVGSLRGGGGSGGGVLLHGRSVSVPGTVNVSGGLPGGSGGRVSIQDGSNTVSVASVVVTGGSAAGGISAGATGLIARPFIQITSTDVNFGDVPVGTTARAAVVLQGVGSGDVGAVAFGEFPAASAPFSLLGPARFNALTSGQSAACLYVFSPTVEGTFSQTLTIVANAQVLPVTIRGRGVEPRPACAADFNNSGVRDVADIFAFLSAWFAGCP